MKLYERFFLVEGKKQAIAILMKKYTQDTAFQIVSGLENIDPTKPKNKYIELFAKLYLQIENLSSNQDEEEFYENLEALVPMMLYMPVMYLMFSHLMI